VFPGLASIHISANVSHVINSSLPSSRLISGVPCVHMRHMGKDTTQAREQDHDFHMRASAEFLAALDKLRRKEKDLPSRAEMLRRLVAAAK
jgi:hypothetical protein